MADHQRDLARLWSDLDTEIMSLTFRADPRRTGQLRPDRKGGYLYRDDRGLLQINGPDFLTLAGRVEIGYGPVV